MPRFMTRTAFLWTRVLLAAAPRGRGGEPPAAVGPGPLSREGQRVVIVTFDGLGTDYRDRSAMPVLKDLMLPPPRRDFLGTVPIGARCRSSRT